VGSGDQGIDSSLGDTRAPGEDRLGRASTAPGQSHTGWSQLQASETRGLWISKDTSAFCGLNAATLDKCFILPVKIPSDLEKRMTPSESICWVRQVACTKL